MIKIDWKNTGQDVQRFIRFVTPILLVLLLGYLLAYYKYNEQSMSKVDNITCHCSIPPISVSCDKIDTLPSTWVSE